MQIIGKDWFKKIQVKPSKNSVMIRNVKKNLSLKYKIKFKNSHPFYSSIQWRLLRRQILSTSNKCQQCNSNYNLQVDHIKPRSKYPDLALDIKNLQVLCEQCNLKKSDIE